MSDSRSEHTTADVDSELSRHRDNDGYLIVSSTASVFGGCQRCAFHCTNPHSQSDADPNAAADQYPAANA